MNKVVRNVSQSISASSLVKCFEINTDFNPLHAMDYQVRAIPSCLFFKNGELLSEIVGTATEEQLIAQIRKHIYA